MAAVIQSLKLNFECAANMSSTLTASHKERSWHNQVNWKPKLRAAISAAVDMSKTAHVMKCTDMVKTTDNSHIVRLVSRVMPRSLMLFTN